jgi:hypothetical protein
MYSFQEEKKTSGLRLFRFIVCFILTTILSVVSTSFSFSRKARLARLHQDEIL